MAVLRRLDQLEKECKKLGLTVVQSGKRPKKEDFIKVLCEYYLQKDFGGKIPRHLDFMLGIKSPMLCFRIAEFEPEDQEALWNSDRVIAEEKYNGVRLLIVYNREEGIHFYSRNISVKNYRPVEYTNIWLNGLDMDKVKAKYESFVIDCELISPVAKVSTLMDTMSKRGVVTETPLQAVTALLALNDDASLRVQQEQGIVLEFHAFHLLELNSKSFIQLTWEVQRPLLEQVVQDLASFGMAISPTTVVRENKRAFYESLVAEGKEGIILKTVDSTYHASESRYHRAWIKVKRTVGESIMNMGFGDTVDAYVVGFEKGSDDTAFANLVGDLLMAVKLKKEDGSEVEHIIAKVSNLPLEERKRISFVGPNGSLSLDPSYYGKVGEIEGQSFSARARRLVHPRLLRWRDDKSPEQCTFDETVMNKLIL